MKRALEKAVCLALAALVVGANASEVTPVCIDTGRQLFVDDYLIASSKGVVRHWNKPMRFGGGHLFVNGEFRLGSLVAEVQDEQDRLLPGFSASDCKPLATADKTKAEIQWEGGNLASVAGRPVSFRFKMHCGTLYSFWVSRSARGESNGYVAAGGPIYRGLKDE